MSGEVARVRERYRTARYRALLKSSQTLAQYTQIPFGLAEVNKTTQKAYTDQWIVRHAEQSFDWLKVWDTHREMDTLHMAVWAGPPGSRLSGLACCLVKRSAVEIRFLEGDGRLDCPLKGLRTLMAVEGAASYAQAIGRTELRIEPVNDKTRDLYVVGFGFEPCGQRGKETYFRRAV